MFTGPNSTTWSQMVAMKRLSDVPPVVESQIDAGDARIAPKPLTSVPRGVMNGLGDSIPDCIDPMSVEDGMNLLLRAVDGVPAKRKLNDN